MSVNAFRRALAIGFASPERYVVLTQVGESWQTRRSRMWNVAADLRRLGVKLQWAWTVEPNPAGTGHHVNAYQWGDFIDQGELSRIAHRRGMGEVAWITWLQSPGASWYGLKLAGAPSYGLKEAGDGLRAERFVEANGGRLSHQTRGFWRDAYGSAFRRARDAEAAALAALYGHDAGEWVRERVAHGSEAGPGPAGSVPG